MPTQAEVLGDRTVSGKEPLCLTRRLKPLHAPLALTRGCSCGTESRACLAPPSYPARWETGGLFHFYALLRSCSALLRRRMKTLLQRLLLVVLMLIVFTITVVVTVYLLGA
jgi:hypothetical protein